MKFLVEITLKQPAQHIVRVMMDELDHVTPYMDSVDAVSTLERSDLPDGSTRILRKWQGSTSTSPAVIRPFLTQETLCWLDDARWFPEEYRVEWNVSSNMSKLYACGGINYFEPHPDNKEEWTRARLTGEISVRGDALPGVPTFIGRKVAPTVERFIIRRFEPNFRDLAAGLQRYFNAKTG